MDNHLRLRTMTDNHLRLQTTTDNHLRLQNTTDIIFDCGLRRTTTDFSFEKRTSVRIMQTF